MMRYEFEKLAKMEVTCEQYAAIETLYNDSSLNKVDFVKSICPILKTLVIPEKARKIVTVSVCDNSGYRKTPNGAYYHLVDCEVIKRDIDIASGKAVVVVKEIGDTYRTGYEYDYMDTAVEFV